MMPFLIEPLGLLHGAAAHEAVRRHVALPLQAGASAFSLARLVGEAEEPILPVMQVPQPWADVLRTLVRAPPSAGLPAGPLVMGILNVTPDSFSDGGTHRCASDAIAAGLRMIGQGAAILDIGGESTRPGAVPVDVREEQARVLPVLAGLRGRGALISVDTRNGATMRAALDAGADLINDVSGLSHDPDAAATLSAYECPVVLMHGRGNPATMAGLARYDDVAVEVSRELELRVGQAVRAGIDRSRIVIDPGIGFAKDTAQNLELLRRLPLLANLGCRVLLGTSRKRFIEPGAGAGAPVERGPGTLVSSLPGLALPGCVLRVHDVAAMVQACRVWQAIQG